MIKHTTSQAGLALIAKSEGCRATRYRCPAGLETIGYGHVISKNERHLRDATLTEAQALTLLKSDCLIAEKTVNDRVCLPLNQNQFDALVSLVFNIGGGAFLHSTLLKKLNAGDFISAAQEFLRWDKSANRTLPGLTARRREEHDLFLTPPHETEQKA